MLQTRMYVPTDKSNNLIYIGFLVGPGTLKKINLYFFKEYDEITAYRNP